MQLFPSASVYKPSLPSRDAPRASPVRCELASTPGGISETPAARLPGPPWGEENDTYPVVASLNDRWRVIVCKNSIQWVLQQRRGGRNHWRGRSYCLTREALIRCSHEHAGTIAGDALVILLRLPERIEVRQ
jgi:hypothetical protein